MTAQTKAAALLILALSAACGGGPDYGAPRVCGTQAAIINGAEATELERRATVKVGLCTGVVIAPEVVITAAHCAGTSGAITTPAGDRIAVWDVITHPDYAGPGNWQNDLAILILDHATTVQPVAIASPRVGQAMISGYGEDENGNAGVLLVGDTWIDVVTETVALTMPGEIDSCYGDSGGPVYQNGNLVAIVSSGRAGDGCGQGAANIAPDAYADWIDAVTGGSVVFSDIEKCN